MARTKDETLREVTRKYLAGINPKNPPSPDTIQGEILDETRVQFELTNAIRPNGAKWRIPDRLVPAQIADILKTLYPIVCIACAGENADSSYDLLSVYQEQGPNAGIYVSDDSIFHQMARQYCYTITQRETEEVMHILRDNVPRYPAG